MTKIAILSDTHGLLRPQVLDAVSSCYLIFHGGDINRPEILETLETYAPLHVVRGNNDKEWAEHLPLTKTVNVEGLRFFLVHNKKDVPKDLTDIDILVFGHSHKYTEETKDGILWLNPGSCGKRRFDQAITFALLTVNGTTYTIEKVQLEHEPKKESQ